MCHSWHMYETKQWQSIDIINNNNIVSKPSCCIDIDLIENNFKERSQRNLNTLEELPKWEHDVFIEEPQWKPNDDLFTINEVTDCTKSLPSGKSSGADGVTYDTITKNINRHAYIVEHI